MAMAAEEKWEVKGCGMLVQKREPGDASAAGGGAGVQTICVRVKHAGVYHDIYVSLTASFGELKKMAAARAGVHPDDVKLLYKDKERLLNAFLDSAGVKDKSKLALVDDPVGRSKRLLEVRRAGKSDSAAKAVASVGVEVDKLAAKVAAVEAALSKAGGAGVAECEINGLTEQLMNQLIKLDAVAAGADDVKAQRRMQVKRVQKYVEMLDAMKIKNAKFQQRQRERAAAAGGKWDNVDLLSSPLPPTTSASAPYTGAAPPAPARYDWELF